MGVLKSSSQRASMNNVHYVISHDQCVAAKSCCTSYNFYRAFKKTKCSL